MMGVKSFLWGMCCLVSMSVCAMETASGDVFSDSASTGSCDDAFARFVLRSFGKKLALEVRDDKGNMFYEADARILLHKKLQKFPALSMLDIDCQQVDSALLATVFKRVLTILQQYCHEIHELYFFVSVDPHEIADLGKAFLAGLGALRLVNIDNGSGRSVECTRGKHGIQIKVFPSQLAPTQAEPNRAAINDIMVKAFFASKRA